MPRDFHGDRTVIQHGQLIGGALTQFIGQSASEDLVPTLLPPLPPLPLGQRHRQRLWLKAYQPTVLLNHPALLKFIDGSAQILRGTATAERRYEVEVLEIVLNPEKTKGADEHARVFEQASIARLAAQDDA